MELTLHTLTGETYRTFAIGADKPARIGRTPDCDVFLLDERVSRRHATLSFHAKSWVIIDHGSTRGTFLNGTRLEPESPTPIAAGDLIRIAAWTFRVFVGASPSEWVRTIDDTDSASSRITSLSTHRAQTQSERCLKLLAECMTTFNNAADEATLAEAALRVALEGSGYARAAALTFTGAYVDADLLDPSIGPGPVASTGSAGTLERVSGTGESSGSGAESGSGLASELGGRGVRVLASMRADASDDERFVFSGSLVREASLGKTAMLSALPRSGSGSSARVDANSIAEFRIHSAMCAPVHLGEAIEGFLYLDARDGESSANSDAPVFCEAVARAFGLALANLKRRDLQRRQAAMQLELSSAREVQEFILPPSEAELGFLRYSMLMKPGLFIAGDLFDVVPLEDGRVAVCLGDVAGHGIGSAMLMSVTQAYLNGQIRASGDPAAALSAVNRYLCDRLSPGRFITLWLGVFSPNGEVAFVDAGHAYWMRRGGPLEQEAQADAASVDRASRPLFTHGPDLGPRSIPIGIFKDARYEPTIVRLSRGSRLVLYSDGIAEERDATGREFGVDRLTQAIETSKSAHDDVYRAFAAVNAFSHASSLSDDATVASIELL